MSSGGRRRSVICYAVCTTRRAPLRKLCGALASRRATRRAWRARAASCQRSEAADPTTSDGAARQTEDVVWRTTVPGTHARAGSYELPGWAPGRRDARPPGRGPPAVGRVGGRAATSSGARRTTGVERTPTSPTTCRDGRRCGEKSCRGNMSGVELAGVATPGG